MDFHKKILILTGPTAVGKTSLSIQFAQQLNGEIISADSRQVYRYMDIGTAKPTPEEQEQIVHHLVDICNPDETYSAGQFAHDAESCIGDILKRGKIPVIVGGTGLYLRALTDGLFEAPVIDDDVKNHIRQEIEQKGVELFYQKAYAIDPEYMAKISPNDRQRIARVLEVYKTTGITMTEHFRRQQVQKKESQFKFTVFCLNRDRQILYDRINRRVLKMLEDGLIEEVKKLLAIFPDKNANALKTVGYKEVIEYLESAISHQKMIELIQRNSRRYAKRQLTWFRKIENMEWINIDSEEVRENFIRDMKSEIF